MGLEIVSVVEEGLGHSGHLVSVDGAVLVIDPLRTVDRYRQVVQARGWRIAWTADTHTHADYVSGSPELARQGAAFFASRGARLEAPHRPVDGGDELDLGGLVLRALPTPGHTPDHLAYLLLDGGRPIAVFTGGSLMVGTVGRPDLLGSEHVDELARSMWSSLQEQLLVLPDDLPVYPTHGAGSFCSAPGTSERTTTIGREKATNPLLRAPDEDSFVRQLVGGLGSLPSYFSWLPEQNRHGFAAAPTPPLAQLGSDDVARLMADGAAVVDVRPVGAFAAGHVPGSLSNALRPVFASWLGWLVEPDRPLVFVTDDSTDRAELVRQCANIGYDRIAGELAGGTEAWRASGRPLRSLEVITAENVEAPVLDVRQAGEYEAGHLPGARHIELGTLPNPIEDLDRPLSVMCGHGERAATAASILARSGHDQVRIVTGGPDDWANVTGVPLERGER
jgi:glyoxylase-like metal-dependent hydrolase (beta-lactamase superfamily II)/rhodanese-related sulfurtransferase